MAKEYTQELDVLALLGPLTSEMIDDSTIKEFAGELNYLVGWGPAIAMDSTNELVYRNPEIVIRAIKESEINTVNYMKVISYFAMVVKRGKLDAVDTLDVTEYLVRKISGMVFPRFGDYQLEFTPIEALNEILTELTDKGVDPVIINAVDNNLSGVFQED